MTLKELYKKAVSTGIENDPRGKDAVLKELDARKKILRNSRKTKKNSLTAKHLKTRILIQGY